MVEKIESVMNSTGQDSVNQQAIDAQRDQLIERLIQSVNASFDVFAVYLGYRLGYYEALSKYGAQTSTELAKNTGTAERYTREWLEQQAVAGILAVSNPQADALERRFLLPAGHEEALVARNSENFMPPLMQVLVAVTRPMEAVVQAYRSGEGVPLSAYGEDFVQGQGAVNRVTFLREIGSYWLPSMPDVDARLKADPPARVADIGTGTGWSSIGMALHYPNIQVDGFDLDERSIEVARENARQYGVEDRVHFYVHDAADPALDGRYDLVTSFEALHDMSNPVGALQTMRRMTNHTGTVLIVDERVAENFSPDAEEDRMMYGWSILHCLPVGMVGKPSAATGTVMRPKTLRSYAQQAGFKDIEVLPVENYFFRLYRLVC